jgi:hypothetical protein
LVEKTVAALASPAMIKRVSDTAVTRKATLRVILTLHGLRALESIDL